ncbi:MAG: helix-turn-helix domain-containing protein [Hyphomicrobiales bacterium]|nr:helix-turn-helix domain-containing protein [Hyphomicrobiales bacterium]
MKEARLAKGLNQSELARKIGATPQIISAIEGGDVANTKYLGKLAKALDRQIEWLQGDADSSLIGGFNLNQVPVRGLVAAGLWQEDGQLVGDETPVPSSPDPRFARLPQVAFRVIGNSMNKLVADGEYVICVDYAETPMPLREGDVVVAERRRAGETERTIKTVRSTRGRIELWPQSTDPAHQKPIAMGAREDDTEVAVVGLVIGFFRPR